MLSSTGNIGGGDTMLFASTQSDSILVGRYAACKETSIAVNVICVLLKIMTGHDVFIS